jgi:hypothetical protein
MYIMRTCTLNSYNTCHLYVLQIRLVLSGDAHRQTYAHVHTYIHTYAHKKTYTCAYTYIRPWIEICTCAYIHTYIHTRRLQVSPVLTGDLTKRRAVSTNTFSVFVSSSLNDTSAEREYLQQHVWPAVRQVVNEFGMEFEFVDPLQSLKSRSDVDFNHVFYEQCMHELQRCQRESCGVDFLCLLGVDDNGTAFPRAISLETMNQILRFMSEDSRQGSVERDTVMVMSVCMCGVCVCV